MQNKLSTPKITIADQLTLIKDGNWNNHHIPFAAFIDEAFRDSDTVETAAEVRDLQVCYLPEGDYGVDEISAALRNHPADIETEEGHSFPEREPGSATWKGAVLNDWVTAVKLLAFSYRDLIQDPAEIDRAYLESGMIFRRILKAETN